MPWRERPPYTRKPFRGRMVGSSNLPRPTTLPCLPPVFTRAGELAESAVSTAVLKVVKFRNRSRDSVGTGEKGSFVLEMPNNQRYQPKVIVPPSATHRGPSILTRATWFVKAFLRRSLISSVFEQKRFQLLFLAAGGSSNPCYVSNREERWFIVTR